MLLLTHKVFINIRKKCIYIYIYYIYYNIYIILYYIYKPLKSEAIHETGLSGNVVASFFPLIIFILLCFNVLSTVPRENRLADFLYIYIYIFFFLLFFFFTGNTRFKRFSRPNGCTRFSCK